VFGLSIACLAVGAAGGAYLAARFLPPLAQTREGVIATWVVRVLFGSAAGWIALQVYFMIYAYANYGHREPGSIPIPTTGKTEILTSTVQSILGLGGLLVGSASVVYLLAPTESPTTEPSVSEHAPVG
jgi:hypothetical protein